MSTDQEEIETFATINFAPTEVKSKKSEVRAKRNLRLRARNNNLKCAISNPALHRLSRRGGVKRTSAASYTDARDETFEFLKKVIGTALLYTEHGKRVTVSLGDIEESLKIHNKRAYGAGISQKKKSKK